MKIAIYPGSFNPYHDGHADIVEKALDIFDKVIICVGRNPDKPITEVVKAVKSIREYHEIDIKKGVIQVFPFKGFLKNVVEAKKATAVIKGIRDTNDFLYEQKQQYWNEDIGMPCPTIYLIADRKLVHVSSSALRALDKISKG